MADEHDELPELDSGMAALVAAYEAETARDEAQVEAALDKVTAKIGAGATGAGLSLTAKIGIVGAVVGVIGVIGLLTSRPPGLEPKAETPVAAEAVVEAEQPKPVVEDEPEPAPTPVAPAPVEQEVVEPKPDADKPQRELQVDAPASSPTKRPVRRNKPEPANDDDDSLMAELALLQRTRRALRDGRPEDALKAVAQHRREFPSGRLAEERDATEVSALCALGRGDEARRKVTAFERAHPNADRDLLGDCE